jgi:hypothetical protein
MFSVRYKLRLKKELSREYIAGARSEFVSGEGGANPEAI